ncbi:glycosyltransferase [Clostridium tarantellae]|uniref:Glycosyltransferase n=1 Tax=Clostridium tarantellae TaxID=39493 RepID=A0A6I1MPC1_9CLOT|nr:glycosyltransferase [Clostridium tarantellae]MPQ43967.1 glycosyltransferase [Clostridium tarantellae]
MKVLHYSLGLPPYRTGGLTKYSYDLMGEQVKQGEEVYLLFPGRHNNSKHIHIKKYKEHKNIKVFELINPLPVPLLNGTKESKKFMVTASKDIYKKFLKHINVEVVHIHTLMGMHMEFLEACRELNIKTVYSTHDYFGLCPKVNFIDLDKNLCQDRDYKKCTLCNESGFSFNKIKILQSVPYREFKNIGGIDFLKKVTSKIKKLKKSKANVDCKQSYFKNLNNSFNKKNNSMELLLNYYLQMFKSIDLFLFNSSVTESIYKKYLNKEGLVLPITHKHIKDKRIIKDYSKNELRVTYLGPNKAYKGFCILVETMNSLKSKGFENIKLNLYGDNSLNESNIKGNIKNHGRYKYSELERIFENTDVLIVPSIWYETFGFITLEALSHGVPVILTKKVGSKDLIITGKEKGFVIEDNSKALEEILIKIFKDRSLLEKLNKNIVEEEFNYSLKEHAKKLKKALNY